MMCGDIVACDICGKTYNTKNSLKVHRRWHNLPEYKAFQASFKAKMALRLEINNPHWKGPNAIQKTGRTRAERKFYCPKGLERHHIDGNPLNNSPNNIAFITRSEHMKLDGRLDKLHSKRRCS